MCCVCKVKKIFLIDLNLKVLFGKQTQIVWFLNKEKDLPPVVDFDILEVRSIRQGPCAVFTAPYSLNTVYQLNWTSLTSCEVMYRCCLIPYAVCSALRTEHVRSLRIGISLM